MASNVLNRKVEIPLLERVKNNATVRKFYPTGELKSANNLDEYGCPMPSSDPSVCEFFKNGNPKHLIWYGEDSAIHRPVEEGPAEIHYNEDYQVIKEVFRQHNFIHRCALNDEHAGPALIDYCPEDKSIKRTEIFAEYGYKVHGDECYPIPYHVDYLHDGTTKEYYCYEKNVCYDYLKDPYIYIRLFDSDYYDSESDSYDYFKDCEL